MTSPGKSGRPSRKVFRWADREVTGNGALTVETKHAFIPRSIRAVHPGAHTFEALVNGVAIASATVLIDTP